MKIGPVFIPAGAALAPMAGITDSSFRLIAKNHGCGLVYSEMISAMALRYNHPRTLNFLRFCEKERPIAIQIFGSDPGILLSAARTVEAAGADILDLNLGCSVPKVVKGKAGAFLARDLEGLRNILEALVKSVSIPVTIKIRKGWDEKHINAIPLAKMAEEAGISAVAVHARTSSAGYRGEADWDFIRELKNSIRIPVIGNGDVKSHGDILKMKQITGCDGVMIGRGSLGNPWIFRGTPPLPGELRAVILEHLDLMLDLEEEKRAILKMRKHLAWYVRGIPGAAEFREKASRVTSKREIETLLRDYLE
ncbi:MAG: tRNA dihydrouridine synthase DusB [bacterium]